MSNRSADIHEKLLILKAHICMTYELVGEVISTMEMLLPVHSGVAASC